MISTEKNGVESSQQSTYINPEFLKPHLSTKFYRTTFKYLGRFYSEKIFDEICEELKVPRAYLLSDDNWVSVEFGRQFAGLVRLKTHDPYIYQKIGHFFLDESNISAAERQFLRTLSPFGFFKAMARFYKVTNQACLMEIKTQGWGKYHLTVSAIEGTVYSDMAVNTLGVLESLKEFYRLPDFKVDLAEKLEPGQELTSYSVNFEFSAAKYVFEKIWKIFSFIGAGSSIGFVLYHLEIRMGSEVLPVLTTAIVLLIGLLYSSRKSLGVIKANMESYYDKSRDKNFQLYQKSELLDRRYREANLLKSLSSELITVKNSQKVLDVCLDSFQSKFDFQKVALFLVSKKRKKLFLAEGRGLSGLSSFAGQLEFEFPNPNAKEGFFASILERGKSALVLDVEEYKNLLQPKNRMILELVGAGSMVICPIQTQEEKYGLIVIFRDKNQLGLTTTDQFLAEKVCNFLALYLDNAANFEKESNLKTIFQQYVPAVVLEQFLKEGSDSNVALAPERTEVLSIFIDLRGFTTMSEKLSPEKVVQVISRYTDFISEIFSGHGAIIDNIVGDALVMFFRCSGSGIEEVHNFFDAIQTLNRDWDKLRESLVALGLSDFRLGVGAHIGPALVGTVGGNIKRNYTALGDTVNIASRIESISKKYTSTLGGGSLTVLATDEVFRRIGYNDIVIHSETLRGRDQKSSFSVLTAPVLKGVLSRKIKGAA